MKQIQGKKVLIAGFGIEGRSTLSYLEKNFDDLLITIADEKLDLDAPKRYRVITGDNYLDDLEEYDTVIRSPGIPLELLKNAKHLTSHMNLFFENCRGKIIGVTGTKGKSTTTTLIYELLKTKHKDVRLAGNIGVPALESLEGSDESTIFAIEISSFQLEDIKYSPNVAVILAVTEDHIDWHESLENYVSAKKNVVKFQTDEDFVFYNKEDKNASEVAMTSNGKQVPVWSIELPYKTALIGKGNETNIAMAIAVAKHFGVLGEGIKNVISNFKPLPHRIELVGEFRGIKFFDDSIATNPSASLNGINALDNLDTVIVGGANKGFDFSDYIKEVSKLNLKNIILMPDTGLVMKEEFEKFSKARILIGDTMEEAVRLAYENTDKGRSVLLSPAATSFNMFSSYKERGDVFKKNVRELGK